MTRLEDELFSCAETVNTVLERLIPRSSDADSTLFEAMRYSTMAGGKRLRPFLVLKSAELFDVPEEWSLPVAAAIEMVHTYSLIHDDLPVMDNDDLRRGLPTCHKKFDEATAILAGDALLTLAFEVLASKGHPDPSVRIKLSHQLALAAGGSGMVGGQVMDLDAETKTLDTQSIILLQSKKTGALFRFSCQSGAILGQRTKKDYNALERYADCIGLAFQITDDLLDLEGSEENLGKAVNKDSAAGKATFVSLLGLEEARCRANSLINEATSTLEPFGKNADMLREVADYIVTRKK